MNIRCLLKKFRIALKFYEICAQFICLNIGVISIVYVTTCWFCRAEMPWLVLGSAKCLNECVCRTTSSLYIHLKCYLIWFTPLMYCINCLTIHFCPSTKVSLKFSLKTMNCFQQLISNKQFQSNLAQLQLTSTVLSIQCCLVEVGLWRWEWMSITFL